VSDKGRRVDEDVRSAGRKKGGGGGNPTPPSAKNAASRVGTMWIISTKKKNAVGIKRGGINLEWRGGWKLRPISSKEKAQTYQGAKGGKVWKDHVNGILTLS